MRIPRTPVLLVVLLLVACEETVDPVLDTDRAFSLYGYLEPGAASQAVRVFPIEGTLRATALEPLPATVVLEGPSGLEAEFRDSLVTYRDGSLGHVFHAAFEPDFETLYTIRVTGLDRRETAVAVRTPEKAILRVGAASGVLGNVRMPVTFEKADQILVPRAIYTIGSTRAPFRWTVPVVYAQDLEQRGREWSVTIDISRDVGVIYTITGLQPGRDPLYLEEMRVEAFVATSEWTPPNGVFDPDLLVQPGVFSNVHNGFGFVGAGYLEGAPTLPDTTVQKLAGFSIPRGDR